MATATKNSATDGPAADIVDAVTSGVESITKTFDENLERVHGVGESVVEAVKLSGTVTIDAYEKAVSSVLDFQKSIAAATRIDAISALVDAQAALVQGVTSAATTAAREALK